MLIRRLVFDVRTHTSQSNSMFGTFSCLQPGRNVVSRQISQTEFIHIYSGYVKTKKEESESEGSTQNVCIGLKHRWSAQMKH